MTWEQHKVLWRSGLTLVTDGWRALGTEWTGSNPYNTIQYNTLHTSGFWICKGTFTHLNEDGLGNKGYPEG